MYIKLKESYYETLINQILQENALVYEKPKKTVVVDFSSPNVAKEMHVGHLRSTIIGDALCRILEYQGYDVVRQNHVGDWGTQFGMLIQYASEEYPNYMDQMPDIKDLETFYKAAKKRFDEDPVFKEKAQKTVVKLQSGDESTRKAWTVICDVSRSYFSKIYTRLNIKLEEKGESFYNPIIKSCIQKCADKDMVQMDEGA